MFFISFETRVASIKIKNNNIFVFNKKYVIFNKLQSEKFKLKKKYCF